MVKTLLKERRNIIKLRYKRKAQQKNKNKTKPLETEQNRTPNRTRTSKRDPFIKDVVL